MARSERRRSRAPRTASRASRAREARQATNNGTGDEEAVEVRRPPAAAPALRPATRRKFSPLGWLRRLQPRAVADVISELRKVTWPTLAETRYLTVVVSIVAIAVGIVLGLFDLAFGWAIEQVFFK